MAAVTGVGVEAVFTAEAEEACMVEEASPAEDSTAAATMAAEVSVALVASGACGEDGEDLHAPSAGPVHGPGKDMEEEPTLLRVGTHLTVATACREGTVPGRRSATRSPMETGTPSAACTILPERGWQQL